jgi:hypothetical protein
MLATSVTVRWQAWTTVTTLLFLAAFSSSACGEPVPAIDPYFAEGVSWVDGTLEGYLLGKRGWGTWGPYYEEHTYGWGFMLSEPATVTHLAVLDKDGDGLSVPFRVGLWDALDSSLLTSIIVPAGHKSTLHDLWRTVPVEPLLLGPGEHYLIGAAPMEPTTDRRFYWNFDTANPLTDPSAIPFDPRVDVSFSAPLTSSEGGFMAPSMAVLVTGAYIGPNIFFAPQVPEPGTMGLMMVAIGGFLTIAKGARAVRKPC